MSDNQEKIATKVNEKLPVQSGTEIEQEPLKPAQSEVDEIDLQMLWQQIIESLKDEGPRIKAAVQQANPKQTGTNTILLQITAEIQKDLYDKFNTKILNVLRQKTGNNNLVFEFELVESEVENNRPLTNAEKYKALSHKNPALELLRQKFNLDIKK